MLVGCAFVLLASAPSRAQDLKTLAKELGSRLASRQLLLRMPLAGKRLRFDADGHCVNTCEPGGWTADTVVRVKEIAAEDGALVLSANRLSVYFDAQRKAHAIVTSPVVIEIVMGAADRQSFAAAINNVFLGDGDKDPIQPPPDMQHAENLELRMGGKNALAEVRPAGGTKWTDVAGYPHPVIAGRTATGEPVYLVSKAVKPPKAVSMRDPEYPLSERQRAPIQVVLLVEVGVQGNVGAIQLQEGNLNMAPHAVEAVSQWKFEPAMLGGKPVASVIGVEVNFRSY